MSEPDNVEMVIRLQDQLNNLVTKLKTILDTSVELSHSPEEVFVYMNFISNRTNELSILSAKFQHTFVEIL